MQPNHVRTLGALALVLLISVGLPVLKGIPLCRAQDRSPGNVTPENTVILSNETDASYCRDFSVLLKRVPSEWIILDRAEVPESAWDKNLILIGQPGADNIGPIIHEVVTEAEAQAIRQDGRHSVLIKTSPWAEGRLVYICTGSDRLLTKRAAEEAITSLVENAPAPVRWTVSPFIGASTREAREYVAQVQYEWDDEELPIEALAMDVGAKSPESLSAEDAAEDVERLFYLFSHGYGGYGLFKARGDFEGAKVSILNEVSTKPRWSTDGFSRLLYQHLAFIHDRHLSVGTYQYGGHHDFWYDTSLELWKINGHYHFLSDGVRYTVLSVNGEKPEAFTFPSLNAEGEPVYRLGMLSEREPGPLVLAAEEDRGLHQVEIPLHRSNWGYFSKDILQEDRIGGIPVVRIRSFSDHHADELDLFLQTAETYKGEPYLIVDLRGNGGGNEMWPITWIARFAGQRPEPVFIVTELNSKTTMMGRANAMEYWFAQYQGTDTYEREALTFRARADLFERQVRDPYWSGPYLPSSQLIPNNTTLIVIVNGEVGSAGEGFIMRLSRLENVVVVGENSSGTLTFGNVSFHQLPHSKLLVSLPININIFMDLEFREERGIFPDLWVPAADALNNAVAAARRGLIAARIAPPEGYFSVEFVPERPPRRRWFREHEELLPIALMLLSGSVFIYVFRRQKPFFLFYGSSWLTIGVIFVLKGASEGYFLIPYGVVFLAIGVWKRWNPKAASETISNT